MYAQHKNAPAKHHPRQQMLLQIGRSVERLTVHTVRNACGDPRCEAINFYRSCALGRPCGHDQLSTQAILTPTSLPRRTPATQMSLVLRSAPTPRAQQIKYALAELAIALKPIQETRGDLTAVFTLAGNPLETYAAFCLKLRRLLRS